MSKQLQPIHVIMLVFAAVLFSAGCSPQGNAKTASFEVGILVMDHMVESMQIFQQSMTERGYVVGQNINYHVYEFESGERPQVDEVAKFDLLLALEAGDNDEEPLGVASSLANNAVPIVFIGDNSFPIDAGYVESLTKPGRNVTGVLQGVADDRRFELFHELVPDAKRILATYDPEEPDTEEIINDLEEQAEAFDLELIPLLSTELEVYAADYIGDMDAVFSVRASDIELWSEFAREQNLPLSADESYEEAQFAIMTYIEDEADMSKKAAGLADQILKGANPGDLPVEEASFLLSINLVNADILGVTIPDSLLEQADEIIRPQSEAGA